MTYLPGTHVIASLTAKTADRLDDPQALQDAVNAWIAEYNLQKLGDIYHHFDPSGFTAVICLSESHISVHTWPEYGLVNLDIYLSNYQRDNDGTVRALYDSLVRWFNGDILQEQIIRR